MEATSLRTGCGLDIPQREGTWVSLWLPFIPNILPDVGDQSQTTAPPEKALVPPYTHVPEQCLGAVIIVLERINTHMK